MTDAADRHPTGLLPVLIGLLEGIRSSDAIPEGLMGGEIGWLTSAFSDPLPGPVGAAQPAGYHDAITQSAAADNLLNLLELAGEIPGDAALQLRRSLHEASERMGAALRRSQADRIRGLYVIIDPEVTGGREPNGYRPSRHQRWGTHAATARQAARQGGAAAAGDRSARFVRGQRRFADRQRPRRPRRAAIGPDHVGLHVGQTDLPVAEARKILAPGQVLGRSNRDPNLIIESQQMGADHVAFGAMYTTTTKPMIRNPQGPERLKQARAAAQVPLVAIGGITAANVGPVVEAGADAICVTAAVGSAPDPEAAAAALTDAIRAAGGRV